MFNSVSKFGAAILVYVIFITKLGTGILVNAIMNTYVFTFTSMSWRQSRIEKSQGHWHCVVHDSNCGRDKGEF